MLSPNWPKERPSPPVGVMGAISEEALKYRNCGLSGLARLVARWLLMHALPLPTQVHRPNRELPLLVTLTSIPSRLGQLKATLNSLLRQSVQPDAVILNLPLESRRQGSYQIPSFLQTTEALEVFRCPTDWGPATKLLPTWQRWRDRPARLLIVDDDNVYPHDFVENFLHWSERFPEAALGYRGHVFGGDDHWSELGTLYGSHIEEAQRVHLLTGTWGFMVHSSHFDDTVLCYEGYPEGAFYVDDIWFNGHLAKKGVERLLIPANAPPLPTLPAYQQALGVEYNADGTYNNQVIAAFAEYWESTHDS